MLPTCARYGMGVIVWSPLAAGWLTGRYRSLDDIDITRGRPSHVPARFDPALPGNQRKLQLVDQLDQVAKDAGCSLTHLAMAFAVAHPAVTSAIIGPRTMEQLEDLLAGASLELDDAVLDRIDRIIEPGTDISAPDVGWIPPSITDPGLRRRPGGERSAS